MDEVITEGRTIQSLAESMLNILIVNGQTNSINRKKKCLAKVFDQETTERGDNFSK